MIQLELFLTKVPVTDELMQAMKSKKYYNAILSIILICILISCDDDTQHIEPSDHTSHKLYNNLRKPHSYQINGLTVENPYFWLLDSNSEETKSWLAQQSEQTQKYYKSISSPTSKTELGTVSNYHYTTAIKNYYFYINKKFQEFEHEWLLGYFNEITFKTVEHPLQLNDDQSLVNLQVTPSGRFAAIHIKTKSGSSFFGQQQARYQWRIFDTANTDWLNRNLPITTQETSFVWIDERQFLYSNNMRTEIILANPLKNPRFDLNFISSQDKIESFSKANNTIIVNTKSHDEKNNIITAPLANIPADTSILIDKVSFKLKLVAANKNKLFFITDWAAPRKRIISVDIKKPQKKYWKEVIAQKKSILQDAILKDGIWILHYKDNTISHVDIAKANSKKTQSIFKKNDSSIKLNTGSGNTAIIEISSLAYSTQPLAVDLKNRSVANIFPQENHSTMSFSDGENKSKIHFYKNEHGTKLPITLIEKNSIKEQIKPTLLITHQVNGESFKYQYNPLLKAFIQNDGRIAVTHIRGDDSYGEAWKKAGKSYNMNNAIADLIGAQQWLVENEYSDRNTLAAYAEIGNALVFANMFQNKNHFKAIVLNQGVYDLVLPEHMNLIRSKGNKQLGEKELDKIQGINPRKNNANVRIPTVLFTDQNRKNYPYIAELQNLQRANRPILLNNSNDKNMGERLKQTWLFLQQELNM